MLQGAVASLFERGTSSGLHRLQSCKCSICTLITAFIPCVTVKQQFVFSWNSNAQLSSGRLIGHGFKIGTLFTGLFWGGMRGRRKWNLFSELPPVSRFRKSSVLPVCLCVFKKQKKKKAKKKKSPCHSQVMIPSVKLDFSHVQSKCGSLDKLQHMAGGGNVSDSAEKRTHARTHLSKSSHSNPLYTFRYGRVCEL